MQEWFTWGGKRCPLWSVQKCHHRGRGFTVLSVLLFCLADYVGVFAKLFAGLLISLDSLPVWVSWLQNFSFMKYATEVK